MSRWNVWRWNRNSIRGWAACAFSGAALATLSGVLVELRAESGDGSAVETRITRDGTPVSHTRRPMTPRRQYETAEDIRARAARMKKKLGRGRETVPETRQSVVTTTYRTPAESTPTASSSQGAIPIVQVRDRRVLERSAAAASDETEVQQKLQELYKRDNLVPPPMTLKELKRQDGRRFVQRPLKKDELEEEKPSLLQRLNPFSRFRSDDAEESVEESTTDASVPPSPIVEPKLRKMTKHYRRPTSPQASTQSPDVRSAEARRQPAAERTASRRSTRSEIEARPAVSMRSTNGEAPSGTGLPVIVPQADPSFGEPGPADLPTITPEAKGDYDLDLDLPLPGVPEVSTDTPVQPRKLSKIDPDEQDHRLSHIPTEIDAETEAKMQQIAARGSVVGLKGFCPVALRNHRELKDARPDYNSIYQGVVYSFSSPDAKVTFDSDPDLFVPVLQGRDVVLLSSEVEAPGSLDYALWYQDRLFLFSSPETMREFSTSPEDYTK